jgi:integrase
VRNLGLDEEITKTDVLAKLKRPKLPETVVDVLSDEEVRELVGCIKPDTKLGARDLAIVLLLLDTGIRANELLTLTLDNVDFDHNEF